MLAHRSTSTHYGDYSMLYNLHVREYIDSGEYLRVSLTLSTGSKIHITYVLAFPSRVEKQGLSRKAVAARFGSP